jgi:hypothetical protein
MSLSYFDLYGKNGGALCEAHSLFLASWDARYLKCVFLQKNTDYLEEILNQGLGLLLDYSKKIYGERFLDPNKAYPSIAWLYLDGVYLSEFPTSTIHYIFNNPLFLKENNEEDINNKKF